MFYNFLENHTCNIFAKKPMFMNYLHKTKHVFINKEILKY